MAEVDLTLTDQELDAVRENREGLEWLTHIQDEGLETVQVNGPPSQRPISDAAFDLIVEFEVSSKQVYTLKYRKPVWPKGASGVTIGIGYDVGYATRDELHADFGGAIPDAMIKALEAALGVKGQPAQAVANALAATVDVPFEAAISVHRTKVLPRWIGLTERSLPNTAALNADQLGALVSLTYNRGASYTVADDRHLEMRNIKAHMAASNFKAVPGDFRAMKRLWPDVPGLQKRREREAQLFEKGL